MSVDVVLVGATGATGNAVAHGLVAHGQEVHLVAGVAPSLGSGTPTRALPDGVPGFATIAQVDAAGIDYDVVVDLSTGETAPDHLAHALAREKNVVLGATGMPGEQLEQLGERFRAADLRLLYAPNFALGAVLMMQVAADLARHLPDVEIVETHHERKRDAPSGTARRTAQLVAAARTSAPTATASDDPARGELVDGVPVHSVRLPGAVAHQEVVFGAPGERLTVRHDALDRSCYATGVALAARRVASCPAGLTIGLEHVL